MKKIYWSEQSLTGLGSRIDAHREDYKYRSRSGQTDRQTDFFRPPSQTLYKYSTNHFNRWSLLY